MLTRLCFKRCVLERKFSEMSKLFKVENEFFSIDNVGNKSDVVIILFICCSDILMRHVKGKVIDMKFLSSFLYSKMLKCDNS